MRGLSEHDRAHGHSEIKALLEFVVFMPVASNSNITSSCANVSHGSLFEASSSAQTCFLHALSRLAICIALLVSAPLPVRSSFLLTVLVLHS